MPSNIGPWQLKAVFSKAFYSWHLFAPDLTLGLRKSWPLAAKGKGQIAWGQVNRVTSTEPFLLARQACVFEPLWYREIGGRRAIISSLGRSLILTAQCQAEPQRLDGVSGRGMPRRDPSSTHPSGALLCSEPIPCPLVPKSPKRAFNSAFGRPSKKK